MTLNIFQKVYYLTLDEFFLFISLKKNQFLHEKKHKKVPQSRVMI